MSVGALSAVDLVALVLLAAGTTLLLGRLRWVRRPSLVSRLEPYVPARGARGDPGVRRELSAPALSSVSGVLVPLAVAAGDRLASVVGRDDELGARLARAGRPVDEARFRVQQFAVGATALLAALGAVLVLGPPVVAGAVLLLGAPLLGVLAAESHLDRQVRHRDELVVAALPVTVEQLGMLVAAGYSLRAALGRLATRSHGALAEDLAAVVRSVRRGASETEALRTWAATSRLPAVERLAGVLALHRDAGDLPALVAEEARAVRAESHRRLIEAIERRSQLVWVPVTVATLVPGLVLLAVPFVAAMRQVTAG